MPRRTATATQAAMFTPADNAIARQQREQRRRRQRNRTGSPAADRTRWARLGSSLASAEPVQRADIDRVEPLADAEQEDADDDERDQHRERDADLHHQRHALRAGRGQVDAVLQRHEADDLADRVAPRHHHQQADQHDRQGQRDILARHRIGMRR